MSNWAAAIPSTTITQEQVDAKLQCHICLEDYRLQEQVLALNCVHYFHEVCIAPWLSKNNFCPTCRSNVRNNVYFNSSAQEQSNQSWTEDEDIDDDGTSLELESGSEESYIDDDDDGEIIIDQSMSDESEVESEEDQFGDIVCDSEDDSPSEFIDEMLEGFGNNTIQISIQTETMEDSIDVSEEENEELSMSDDSFFYEAETGSVLFSDDDE